MRLDMRVDMRVDLRVDMRAEMRLEMPLDMRVDMLVDMHVDICVWPCIAMPHHRYRLCRRQCGHRQPSQAAAPVAAASKPFSVRHEPRRPHRTWLQMGFSHVYGHK